MTSTRTDRIHGLVAAIGMFGLFTLPSVAQRACAADKLWDNVNGGFFSEPSNWFGGVPGTGDVARFETTNSNLFQRTYTVDFTASPINQQLVVEDDGVTFNLMGHTYELKNTFVAAALGTVPNRTGSLTVTGGTLKLPAAADLEIASVGGGSGVLNVGAGGVLQASDVLVGLNGQGTFEINSGGIVFADHVTLGVNGGSTGEVTVTGHGSSLRIFNDLNMFSGLGSGSLRIKTGGEVDVFGQLFLGGNDALHLEGGLLFVKFLQGLDQRPFFWTSGALSFVNCLDDLTIPNAGVLFTGAGSTDSLSHVSGNLTLLPGATTKVSMHHLGFNIVDRIQVDGNLVLNGGNLILSLDSGFLPSSGSQFEIITTNLGIFGSFANVANGQRLAVGDSSFLVNYGSASPFNPKSVVISSFQPATPGDFDVDGDVDGNDFLVWQRGDSPNHGNIADLATWRVNFGTNGAAAASSAVPEPSDGALLLSGLLLLLVRTRKERTTKGGMK